MSAGIDGEGPDGKGGFIDWKSYLSPEEIEAQRKPVLPVSQHFAPKATGLPEIDSSQTAISAMNKALTDAADPLNPMNLMNPSNPLNPQ